MDFKLSWRAPTGPAAFYIFPPILTRFPTSRLIFPLFETKQTVQWLVLELIGDGSGLSEDLLVADTGLVQLNIIFLFLGWIFETYANFIAAQEAASIS